ncbi:hypothetical protein ONZ45_g15163 [Pleurotus djamor]|nr:hypothetical protein ONZ45_g15163 [Pleurotus djamor]
MSSSHRLNDSSNLAGLRKRTTQSPITPSSGTTTTSSFAFIDHSLDTPEFSSFRSTGMEEKSPAAVIPGMLEETMSSSDDTESDGSQSDSAGSGEGEVEVHEEKRNGVLDAAEGGIGNGPAKANQSPPKPQARAAPQGQQHRVRVAPPQVHEFDLAVVVALVSPIGSWLTGGDHVKNLLALLLVSLLIFYLHQIIEGAYCLVSFVFVFTANSSHFTFPWTLYHTCRPRHELRSSTLHGLELFFLVLTVISPLLGALLLRLVGNAIVGPDALSWFNVTLFVLATGLRPWRHLVHRMTNAAEELQGIVCEGICGDRNDMRDDEAEKIEQQKRLDLLLHRIEAMEKELLKVKTKMSVRQEEVYDYVDDAVEDVDRRVREAEGRLVKTMHDVDQVGAYIRKTYTAPYLEIIPRWILRSLSVPFISAGEESHFSEKPRDVRRDDGSISTLRTMESVASSSKSVNLKPNHTNSRHTSHYTSPCGSTKSALYPIPEEPSRPSTPVASGFAEKHREPLAPLNGDPPSSSPPPPSAPDPSPLGLVGSLVFLPFRMARGILSWGLGYSF